MGYILYREAMAPPSGSTPKMPRSCQQSHQLSVAQIAVTAKDMDADGDAKGAEDAKDAEHADSRRSVWCGREPFSLPIRDAARQMMPIWSGPKDKQNERTTHLKKGKRQ